MKFFLSSKKSRKSFPTVLVQICLWPLENISNQILLYIFVLDTLLFLTKKKHRVSTRLHRRVISKTKLMQNFCPTVRINFFNFFSAQFFNLFMIIYIKVKTTLIWIKDNIIKTNLNNYIEHGFFQALSCSIIWIM